MVNKTIFGGLNMKKKLLALSLAVTMVLALFTGGQLMTAREGLQQMLSLGEEHELLKNMAHTVVEVEELECGTTLTIVKLMYNYVEEGTDPLSHTITMREFVDGDINAITVTENREFTATVTYFNDKTVSVTEYTNGFIKTETLYANGISETVLESDDSVIRTTFYDDKQVSVTEENGLVTVRTYFSDGSSLVECSSGRVSRKTIYDDKTVFVTEHDGRVVVITVFSDGTEVMEINGVVVTPGHVLAATTESIGIGDALQILRFVVGLDSIIDECDAAFQAALIVSTDTPGIGDALQILRHVSGLPSELD
jgi:hypothetical protein